jgi:hypothetical protein
MGVDRRLFISNRWNVQDVKETVESLFDLKIDYQPTHSPDYATLLFKLGEDENRQLNVHINYEHGGFRGLLLTLSTYGKSEEILKGLAERLGGFYNHEDFNDTWEEFPYVAAGDLEFLVKKAVKTGATDGRDSVKFREYLVESEKAHEAWEEENRKGLDKLLKRHK